MGGLYPTLPLAPGEPPEGYVSRLAQLHNRDMRFFCTDFNFSMQAVIDGQPAVLNKIAELAGIEPGALGANAICRVADGRYLLRGEALAKQALRRQRVFVCPICLQQDIETSNLPPHLAAYMRTSWQLTYIRSCVIHDVELTEITPENNRQRDLAGAIRHIVPCLDALASQAQRVIKSGLEGYIATRIERGKSVSWIDRLELYVAAKFCELIGALKLRGHKAKCDCFSERQWREAGDIGYAVVSQGETAIWDFLSEARAAYPDVKFGNQGVQAVLGPLNEWLRRPVASQQPIIDLIYRHTCETTPVGPGDTVLGIPVERRRLHSIRSASIEYAVHPKRLRTLLFAAGLFGAADHKQVDGKLLFDAEAHRPLLERIATSMPLTEVWDYLGAGRVHARHLYDHGFIKPIFQSDACGIGNHAFARDDLDDFLRRLQQGATDVDTIAPPIFKIADAARRANRSAAEIVSAILDHRLRWKGRLLTEHGFAAIVVDLREIKEILKGAPPDALPFRAAAKRLNVGVPVIERAVSSGLLSSVVVKNPINRCPLRVIPLHVIEAFDAKYASLFSLSHSFSIHHVKLQNLLKDSGVRPALDKESLGVTCYLRDDAERVIRAQ